jgi:hypothetical protein
MKRGSSTNGFGTVYHLAEAENWASIQRHGLLSTSKLLDLAGATGEMRRAIERRQRTRSSKLPNGIIVRHQLPMPPAALLRCLAGGLAPEDWYALLNSGVFFWYDPDRLNRQRRACGPQTQIVMRIDAERMLERHADRAAVTPFNTGNARRFAARRSRATFVLLSDWRRSGWASEAKALGIKPRPRRHPPAELVVFDAVEDIFDFVIDIRRLEEGEVLK